MKRFALAFSATVAVAMLLLVQLTAHHAATMYDANNPKTIRGSVTGYRWVNPHIYVHVMADAAPGQPAAEWVLEGSSPGNMTRMGWSRNSFPLNTRVQAEFNPMRDGTPKGYCRKFVLLDTKAELQCTGAINAGEKPNIP